MKIFYGVNKDGIPYRKKSTRLFNQAVIKTELAIRKECEKCQNDYWVWPDNQIKLCAFCMYENLLIHDL